MQLNAIHHDMCSRMQLNATRHRCNPNHPNAKFNAVHHKNIYFRINFLSSWLMYIFIHKPQKTPKICLNRIASKELFKVYLNWSQSGSQKQRGFTASLLKLGLCPCTHMGQFLQGGKNGRLLMSFFFLKVEPPCDQTWWDSLVFSILSCFSYVLHAKNTLVGLVGPF